MSDNPTVTHREKPTSTTNRGAGQKKPLKNPFSQVNVFEDTDFPEINYQNTPQNRGQTNQNQAPLRNPFGQQASNNEQELSGSITLNPEATSRRQPSNPRMNPQRNQDFGYDPYQQQHQPQPQPNVWAPQDYNPNPNQNQQYQQPQQDNSFLGSLGGGSFLGTFFNSFRGGNNNFQQQAPVEEDYANEPPLLEDLGIDLNLIKERTLSVVKFKKPDEQFVKESDMSGPLLFALIFGSLLMLAGKIHFSYIYGFGLMGTIAIYFIVNMMGQTNIVHFYNTMSILGYSLLPIVGLAALHVFLPLKNYFGLLLALVCIAWATISATNFFEVGLKLEHKRWLIAYPIFLFYLIFVLITVF